MTNREMAKGAVKAAEAGAQAPQPNEQRLPPMPAPEDSRTPTTDAEPIDSPQRENASLKREPPAPGRAGLATKRP